MADILLTAARFRVERRRVRYPDGSWVDRELVVHPGAVLILPLLDAQTVVMIRNYRFSVGRELLELPAGTLETGEEPAACARRELEEETGYQAGRLEPLCRFYTTPGFTDELMYAFVATELRPTRQCLDRGEQIRVEPMPLAEALAATLDGRIIDGKTIVGLHLHHYRHHRERKGP